MKKKAVKKKVTKKAKKPSYESLERKIRSLVRQVGELKFEKEMRKVASEDTLTVKAIDLFRDLYGFVNMDAIKSIVDDCSHPDVDSSTSWLDIKQLIADYNDEDYATE